MATKNAIEKAPAPETALTAPEAGAIVAAGAVNFEADAGRGMEGATAESFAIPFLSVLQKGSPQVDEASGAALPNARQGMLYENVTGRLFDGKAGVRIVPCAYRSVFLRWAPRGMGGGFKGEFAPDLVSDLRLKGQVVELERRLYFPLPDGSVNPDKCDRLADVRNHYVLLLAEDGSWTQALLSLGSTQIRKSKQLMSMLSSIKVKGSSGMYTPASWANVVRLTTVPESNDKGSWMGVRVELDGLVSGADIYAAGRSFNESVRKGQVEAKYEDAGEPNAAPVHAPGAGGGAF